jgi:hypothetical protein
MYRANEEKEEAGAFVRGVVVVVTDFVGRAMSGASAWHVVDRNSVARSEMRIILNTKKNIGTASCCADERGTKRVRFRDVSHEKICSS